MKLSQVDEDLTTFHLHPAEGGHDLLVKKTGTTLKNWDIDYYEALIQELKDILGDMERMENAYSGELAAIHPSHVDSAKNLLHYLALRKRDIRKLQTELASLGLSSLGRSESHVMANVIAVLGVLEKLAGFESLEADKPEAPTDLAQGTALLDIHTKELFGTPPEKRDAYIMVTMPTQAATDYQLVKTLLADGMDCVRINCAHDEAADWSGMIENLHRAEKELNKKCRIFMDLAGHKLRTGPIENLPASVRWSPKHDALGEVSGPARIWLTPVEQKTPPALPMDACIPVPGKWLSRLNVGDGIEFTDTRGKKRSLEVVAAVGRSRVAECYKSAFIVNGVKLVHRPQDTDTAPAGEVVVSELPAKEQFILLARGDMLILTKGRSPGKPPVIDARGQVLKPATVGVTAPEVFEFVKPGDRIWFNDGKIGGVIRFKNKDQVHVEITQAGYKGSKLRAGKGINLPDSELKLPALTKKDISDLKFIAANADAVCFSFVNDASDVYRLQTQLAKLGGKDPGIVLKIETLRAFEHLPGILFAAMRSPCVGVMIARGDLAVECGFERLAEIQEEILWFCEAAHVPVIWATEVLEKLAKKGQPSRAEITDAAMAVRAECVMLNKGPYIADALLILDDILARMRAHQSKKSSMLRELKLAHRLDK
ncbi:MAG TPA: pyruvate kinase [Methanocella sp.]|uniref:pyruvate kinase n=1 Tax=Methanocella sp. TaxID=2052833 RepID=UPI002C3B47F0|nr:pyruvate kinase [Methanocella sp.]HTY92140.1 pyruvate kinase [Methanocella sp.]